MKKLRILFTGLFVLTLSFGLFAQDPPDPPDHGETTDQEPGGQAPLNNGAIILLVLGAAYGGKKVYELRKIKTVQ